MFKYIRVFGPPVPPPPPPLGTFVDHICCEPYYVPRYFQVVCSFSMHGQGNQRSLKQGTLDP